MTYIIEGSKDGSVQVYKLKAGDDYPVKKVKFSSYGRIIKKKGR